MKEDINTGKNLYYTNDHEWIDFQGSVAYMGICGFKLTGFREIDAIDLHESLGFHKKGEVIATISYGDYKIEAHMPVDGKILQVNEALLNDGRQILMQQPEGNGWIALIVPLKPFERDGLILPKEYRYINTQR